MKANKTKYQQYREYLSYYGLRPNEFTFTDWKAMVVVENQMAQIAK